MKQKNMPTPVKARISHQLYDSIDKIPETSNIPGVAGWHKHSGRWDFYIAADLMSEYGIPEKKILQTLTDLYLAVAQEFGH